MTLTNESEIILFDTFAAAFARIIRTRFPLLIAQLSLVAGMANAFKRLGSQFANTKDARIHITNGQRAEQTYVSKPFSYVTQIRNLQRASINHPYQ